MKRTTRTLSTAALSVTTGLAVVAGGLLGATGAQAGVTTSPRVDTGSRAGALAAYRNMYLPALAVASGSSGSTGSCSPGSMSGAGQNAALAIVNYYRSMAKLAPAKINGSWSAGAQRSALIQAANGRLNHYPSKSARCYSAQGALTSARSNLGYGYSWSGTPDNIIPNTPGVLTAGFLDDWGNASTLGHRRWVLDPGMQQVGVGQVGSFLALQVNAGSLLGTPKGSPAYVAWPSVGYVPKALIPRENTWSFSASDAGVTMSGVRVSVKSGGRNVPTSVKRLPNGFGKPAVEFVPSAKYTGGADKAYTVTISGMKKGNKTLPSYTYTTTLFDQG